MYADWSYETLSSWVCLEVFSEESHLGVFLEESHHCHSLDFHLDTITHYTRVHARKQARQKGKERKSIYIAPFCTKVHTECSGMDHTVLPASNTMPAFPS